MEKDNRHLTSVNLEKVYSQVPPDYWDRGFRSNLVQYLYHSLRFRAIRKLVADLPKGAKILDVGCGSGFAVEHCVKERPDLDVYGIDVAPALVEYAKKTRPKFKFLLAHGEELSFGDKTFDALLYLDTIEHLIDPLRSLREARRVLKDDGAVIILVALEHHPLFRVIWWLWMKTKGRVWHEAHLRIFTNRSLRDLVTVSGLRVSHFKNLFLGMSALVRAKKPNNYG